MQETKKTVTVDKKKYDVFFKPRFQETNVYRDRVLKNLKAVDPSDAAYDVLYASLDRVEQNGKVEVESPAITDLLEHPAVRKISEDLTKDSGKGLAPFVTEVFAD